MICMHSQQHRTGGQASPEAAPNKHGTSIIIYALLEAARNSQEQPGRARSSQEQPGRARRSQEDPLTMTQRLSLNDWVSAVRSMLYNKG